MNKKVMRFISLTLAILMIFSLCACGETEEEEEEIKYASEVPAGKAEILDRFNSVLATAKESKPAVKFSLNDREAKDCECENEYIKASFKTVASKIVADNFSKETKYGEAATDVLPIRGSEQAGSLALTDITSAYIVDNEADKNYKIVIKINPETNPEQDGSVYGKLYNIEKDEDVLKNFDSVKDFMTVESYSATYGTGTITAEIDKATDHLVKLWLSRDVNVETEVTGQGTLASVGTVPLKFLYKSTAYNELDWDNPATEDIIEA